MLLAKQSLQTILFDNPEQFYEYIQLSRHHLDQLAEKQIQFIIAGSHWLSGKLQLSLNANNIKLAIMDSIGLVQGRAFTRDDDYKIGNTGLDIVAEVKKIFPTTKLYFTDKARQHSTALCPVFAMNSIFKSSDSGNDPQPSFEQGFFRTIPGRTEKTIPLDNASRLTYVPIVPQVQSLRLVQSRRYLDRPFLNRLGFTDAELNAKTKDGSITRWDKINQEFTETNRGATAKFNKYKQTTIKYITEHMEEDLTSQIEKLSGAFAITQLRLSNVDEQKALQLKKSEENLPMEKIMDAFNVNKLDKKTFNDNYNNINEKEMIVNNMLQKPNFYLEVLRIIFSECIQTITYNKDERNERDVETYMPHELEKIGKSYEKLFQLLLSVQNREIFSIRFQEFVDKFQIHSKSNILLGQQDRLLGIQDINGIINEIIQLTSLQKDTQYIGTVAKTKKFW